jgi:glutamine synthetase
MIRIPEPGRFRTAPRGRCRQSLSPAGGHNTVGDVKTLPLNLLDALRALDASEVLKPALGAFLPACIQLKTEEWNAYARHLTQWERDTTLDC